LLLVLLVLPLSLILAFLINRAVGADWPLNIIILASPLLALAIIVRPVIGIALIIVMPHLGQLQRAGTLISGFNIVFTITLFTWIILLLMKNVTVPKTPLLLPLIIWSISLFISIFMGHIQYFHFSAVTRGISNAFIVVMGASLINDEKTLKSMLKVLFASIFFVGGLAIIQAITGTTVIDIHHPVTAAVNTGGTREGFHGRAMGTMADANIMGLMLALPLPLLFAYLYTFADKNKSSFGRFLISIVIYVSAVGIILSQSRTIYVALVIIFLAMLPATPKKKRISFSVFYIFIPIVCAGILFFQYHIYDRNPISEDDSVKNRAADFYIIRDHLLDNPKVILTGTGIGRYKEYDSKYTGKYGITRKPVLHNNLTRLLVEFSVLVFLAYIFLWISICYSLSKIYKKTPRNRKLLIFAFMICFFITLLWDQVQTGIFTPYVWIMILFYNSALSIYGKEEKSLEADNKIHAFQGSPPESIFVGKKV